MTWPVVILRDNGWEACVLESSAPYPTPPHNATFEERIHHYVAVHQYREIPEQEKTEIGADGKSFRVVTMERVS
jgi:hypothetical protein